VTVDVVYCAWNRLAFTELTFDLLVENTDWARVERLIVYDDGSTDGTAEWLENELAELVLGGHPAGASCVFRQTRTGSPPALMNRYLAGSSADAFVKIDNDIAVPPGWLGTLLDVAEAYPMFDLIGIEAGRMGYPGQDGARPVDSYRVEEASHIGGVGFMRTRAFAGRSIPERGRFGFTEWQKRYAPARGWIFPDLLVPQIDRVPIEPWQTLSRRYVEAGWQRPWPMMDPHWSLPYFDWLPEGAPA
jgi:glycosyltransferase involved in cell wall biosynthesis